MLTNIDLGRIEPITNDELRRSEELKQDILTQLKTLEVNDRVKKSIFLLLHNELTTFRPEVYEELHKMILLIKENPELRILLNQFAPLIFMAIANIDASSRACAASNVGTSGDSSVMREHRRYGI